MYLHQQEWWYIMSFAKVSEIADVDSTRRLRWSLNSLSSIRTVWRLKALHADCVSLSIMPLVLSRCFLSTLCMHQTHYVLSWSGPPIDERRRFGGSWPSVSSSHWELPTSVSELDVWLILWASALCFFLRGRALSTTKWICNMPGACKGPQAHFPMKLCHIYHQIGQDLSRFWLSLVNSSIFLGWWCQMIYKACHIWVHTYKAFWIVRRNNVANSQVIWSYKNLLVCIWKPQGNFRWINTISLTW